MATTFTIEGASRQIRKESISITTSKNGRPDIMRFQLEKAETNVPVLDDEVILTIGGVKKFAGRVVRVSRSLSPGDVTIKNIQVECQDYSWDANKGEPVAEVYENETVNDIIDDIVTRYPQLSGFTQNNVDCPEVIDYLFLDHKKFTEVLRFLSDMTGYNFYIDYDKDIHFYIPGKATELASFDVQDDNNTYRNGTLRVDSDATRIINWIVVEGGLFDASKTTTENFTASGGETQFNLANFYSGVTVTLNAASQTVGTFGLDDQDGTFDFLYDFSGKRLVVDAAAPIIAADAVALSGNEKLPVLTQVDEPTSIAQFGILPKPRIKKTALKTLDSAAQFGFAELGKFADEQKNGGFQTFEDELRAGQRIRINSSILGVDDTFDIQSTTSTAYGQEGEIYFNTNVVIASAELTDAAGILARLLLNQNESTSSSEILRIFKLIKENITVDDAVVVNPNKQEIDENIDVADTIDQAENKTIIWVLAPYVHTTFADNKRQLTLDNSPCLA